MPLIVLTISLPFKHFVIIADQSLRWELFSAMNAELKWQHPKTFAVIVDTNLSVRESFVPNVEQNAQSNFVLGLLSAT